MYICAQGDIIDAYKQTTATEQLMEIKTIEQLRTMSANELSDELSKATWAQIRGEISGNQLFKYHSLINDVRDELEIAHTKPTITVSL